MKVRSINKNNEAELKKFVSLERELLSHHTNYISAIDEDVIGLFTGKSNLYQDVDFNLFVVSNENKDVGRCAAIINKKYQRDKEESVGSIGFFAGATNCKEEIQLMIQEAEDWLKKRDVKRIIAPWDGVNAADSLYAQTFESPMFPIPWHPDYYLEYFIGNGYTVKHERLLFEVDFSSEKFKAAKEKYLDPTEFTIRTIDLDFWDRDIDTVRKLFNETFKNEWESYIYTTEEFAEMFEPLRHIADPKHILIAEDKGMPIAFCFALVDLTPVFRTFNGVFEPIHVEKLMTAAKNYNRAGAYGIGVLPGYTGKGVSKSLLVNLYDSYEKYGLKSGLYFLVNDYNIASRRLAESIGGTGQVVSKCLDKTAN